MFAGAVSAIASQAMSVASVAVSRGKTVRIYGKGRRHPPCFFPEGGELVTSFGVNCEVGLGTARSVLSVVGRRIQPKRLRFRVCASPRSWAQLIFALLRGAPHGVRAMGFAGAVAHASTGAHERRGRSKLDTDPEKTRSANLSV
jgi:hypothetical protein